MQKIQLSKDSLLVRYAYLGTLKVWPGSVHRTSLCELFWRCVDVTLTLLVGGIAVGGLGVLAYRNPYPALGGLVGAVLSIGAVVAANEWAHQRSMRRRLAPPKPKKARTGPTFRQLAYQTYKGFKNKYCPLVEIQ